MKKSYKVLAIVALMVTLFAVPLMANVAYPIKIDGIPLQSDIMWKDNRVYVPIRLVAENMNCDVAWKNGQVAITTAAIHRPLITGDADFISMVNQAMDLLQAKDAGSYAMICQNVKVIEKINKAKESNKYSLADSYGHFIRIYPYLHSDNKRFVPEFLAGVLAHEGSHRCYNKVNTKYNMEESEHMAYMRGIATLKVINAPQWMVDETEYAMDNWQSIQAK